MCMGPKCPCIYPPMPHKDMKYVTFRERSPIDRVLIKSKLNEISKTLLKKFKYIARPPSTLQYQIFSLANLLGEESDSWFRVSHLFSDPQVLKNRITELDVNKLTQKQIEKSQYWLEEYTKLVKDNNIVTVFADAAKGILSKIVEVEQEKHKELIKDLKEVCLKQYDIPEEVAVLSITQETLECPQKIDQSCDSKITGDLTKFSFDSPQKTIKNTNDRPPNSSTTLFCKFLDRSVQKSPLHMSFCRSPDKSFRDSRRTPNKSSDKLVKFDDIVSLKKELELIQRDITRLEGINKKKEFLLNRSSLRLKTEEVQQVKVAEFNMIREKTQKDESVDEKQKKLDLLISRDHSAFRKELNCKRSPTNIQFQQYLEKYTSKYIPMLDRITSQQQELRSIKSQLQIASSIKKLKQQN